MKKPRLGAGLDKADISAIIKEERAPWISG